MVSTTSWLDMEASTWLFVGGVLVAVVGAHAMFLATRGSPNEKLLRAVWWIHIGSGLFSAIWTSCLPTPWSIIGFDLVTLGCAAAWNYDGQLYHKNSLRDFDRPP